MYVAASSSVFWRLMRQPSITIFAACCRDASPKTGIDYKISVSFYLIGSPTTISLVFHGFMPLCRLLKCEQ